MHSSPPSTCTSTLRFHASPLGCHRYDFDVQGNGVFRLFPTGSNHYPKDVEILNSYGRRPNDNLLLEYGFAMLDNEWDEVELVFSLSSMEPTFFRKKAILRASGQHTCRYAIQP